MTTVSWVNGGWQGGWCWDGVVNELESAGHAALAPTLPGLEPGDRDRSGLGIPEFVGAAAAALKRLDWREVVVVGHSEGSPAPRHG
jgi:pimeloyl-ACP methyl ester carboxylesterase